MRSAGSAEEGWLWKSQHGYPLRETFHSVCTIFADWKGLHIQEPNTCHYLWQHFQAIQCLSLGTISHSNCNIFVPLHGVPQAVQQLETLAAIPLGKKRKSSSEFCHLSLCKDNWAWPSTMVQKMVSRKTACPAVVNIFSHNDPFLLLKFEGTFCDSGLWESHWHPGRRSQEQ